MSRPPTTEQARGRRSRGAGAPAPPPRRPRRRAALGPDRAERLAPARGAAAAAARRRRLGGAGRRALRRHRGDLDHRRRDALLGGPLQPGLDPGLKLHGLYDNDHRRIRHSTLDELPSLVSASALGTLVLDGLLALSPVGPLSPKSAIVVGIGALARQLRRCAAVLRFLWHRLTGVADRDRDRPGGRGRHGRAAGLHPPGGAPARWSATSPRRATRTGRAELPRLGSIADISRVAARARRSSASSSTEQEMSEPRRRAPDRGVQGGRPRRSPSCPSTTACSGRGSSSTGWPSCRCSTSASPTRRARPWR